MSPVKSTYKELALELVETLQDQHRKARWPPMEKENKYKGVVDPFKIFLKEAIEWYRNVMMDKFS